MYVEKGSNMIDTQQTFLALYWIKCDTLTKSVPLNFYRLSIRLCYENSSDKPNEPMRMNRTCISTFMTLNRKKNSAKKFDSKPSLQRLAK